ncbi:AHH domain-containing protein [Pyxidicoccus xibeiensis]|uniref:AHH domain-containing protein n=1 Tax=Pyxidicoccus xibeiensis TaxID=2906759 RepID=UPI0020A6DBA9|nr:AHH domain-containing protein [Pyxidicoccus xibeiensis]MCP3143953.1 AHH domain-containing protein [Pyxidicoccus xibeiensis]
MAGSDKHITNLWKRKKHKDELGCIQKHVESFDSKEHPRCAYRNNGHKELSKHPTRQTLYELDLQDSAVRERLQSITIPRERKLGANSLMARRSRTPVNPLKPGQETVWGFKHQDNFKHKAYEPFNHHYHHIMPDEVLKNELSYKELNVLQAAEYNINSGNNIIILPHSPEIGIALALPTHRGRHGRRTNYAQDCINEINRIKRLVGKGKQADPPHPITDKTAPDVKKDLETWQYEEFDDIVAYGREAASSKMSVGINRKLRMRSPG